ncbi:MAG: cytochrome P450 [Novosphingobium sp.]|nr:cytochrome P450 [Novosphingobium sp.]
MERPAHVPAELVRPYPFKLRGARSWDLPRTMIPEIQTYPPIFWAENMHEMLPGAWVPRSMEALRAIYMDTEHFTVKGTSGFAQMIGQEWYSIPHESDPPLHSKYRMLLNPMFAPKHIARLEEHIREFARERLLELRPRGHCDFVADFAFEFPIRVFLELMGMPQHDMATFLAWEHAILRSAEQEPVTEALAKIVDYLAEQCEDRRSNPCDDLITLAVQGEIEGRKLDDDELIGFCFNLFVGGLDTVSTNMSNHFRHLAENPADQDFLRANPERIGDAIDELMRAYAAVTTIRLCTQDTVVEGIEMKAFDLVLMPTHLAANDPVAFPEPEKVDFTRKPRHVSFGYGPHLCIGMHLAKREMRIAMEEALAILPPFRLAEGAEIESFLSGIIGPTELPLVWEG